MRSNQTKKIIYGVAIVAMLSGRCSPTTHG